MSALSLQATLDVGPLRLDLHLDTRSRRISIEGPSGSGKSTCLRILAGLERRARGTLVVDGEAWMDTERGLHLPPWQRGVGWVPQDALLFPNRPVRSNLAFAGASPEEVLQVARMLGVEELLSRRPRNLSGGEQQRVALGRALLCRPRLLLLDEPFAALDAPLRRQVAGRLAELCDARGVAVVMVSHDASAANLLVREHWTLSAGGLRLRSDADRGQR